MHAHTHTHVASNGLKHYTHINLIKHKFLKREGYVWFTSVRKCLRELLRGGGTEQPQREEKTRAKS